jgi:pyrimidine operon attenuation protein / uracil phosphoribosyltransferase
MKHAPRRPPSEADLVVRRELLDESGLQRTLRRLAQEIAERHPPGGPREGEGDGGEALALVGIRTGGLVLAERLARLLPGPPPIGAIDITLYRDDVFEGLPRPEVGSTELPFSLPGRTVILVDDVLYTGRTVRAALDALMDFGRPRRVELAVLVDRGHRELPIQADFVGLRVETTRSESVRVMLSELGEPDRVVLRARAS